MVKSFSILYLNWNISNILLNYGHLMKERATAKIKKQYNQVSHLTQNTTWESNKNTIKNHQQEPRGQPFPSR